MPRKPIIEKPREPEINLDHRNYGAWYIHPKKWEERFQSLSDPKSIDMIKSRNLAKQEKRNKSIISKDVLPEVKVNTLHDFQLLIHLPLIFFLICSFKI